MDPIDYIIYTATSTDLTTGDITVIQAQYFVPFFDFLMLAIVFFFTISFLSFFKDLIFPKKFIAIKYKMIKDDVEVKTKKIWN